MKTINLRNGNKLLLDDDDFARFSWLNWYQNDNGYVVTDTPKVKRNEGYSAKQRIHRLIVQCPEGMDVDHANGNKLDNQKSNLRICTRSENLANKEALENKMYSPLKGAYFCKRRKKWLSLVRTDERLKSGKRKQKSLGYFDSAEKAHEAYKAWAQEYYGDFAVHRSRL